jgi:hypothetical protein
MFDLRAATNLLQLLNLLLTHPPNPRHFRDLSLSLTYFPYRRFKMAPVTRSMKRSTRKTVARKTVFNNTYLGKSFTPTTDTPVTPATPTPPAPPAPPTTPTTPTVSSPNPIDQTYIASASKSENGPQSAKSENESLPSFQDQKDYTAAFRDRFDKPRVRRDDKMLDNAQRQAYEEAKSRLHKTQRSYQVGQRSTTKRSSDSNTIIDDPSIIRLLGLNRSEEEYNAYQSTLEHRPIKPLKNAYPPLGEWASESQEATDHWQERWKYTPLKDGRGYRWIPKPVVQLDRSRMTVVRPDERVVFFDPVNPTRPVLVVLRDLVQVEEVLNALSVITLRATCERRCARVRVPPIPTYDAC